MKNFIYILLIAPLFFISSCEEEEETQSGYDCISNTCTAVFESPQYLTLSDCQSACADNNGGNSNLEIGAIYQGGLVFYVDETGEHGLVAAMEDLEGSYEWGCDGVEVNGADGIIIGSGYQNTMDIVNQGCSTENGGITAAQAALDIEINGYSDWYLPSKGELNEMYNTIGKGGQEGNVGVFTGNWYWSSSESGDNLAWIVHFDNGAKYFGGSKSSSRKVRVIRAF